VKYTVTLDGKSVEVEIDGDHVTVAGQVYTASLGIIPGTPLRQLLIDGRPSTLAIESLGRGRWALAPGGERWEVEVLDERARHIQTLAGGADRPAVSQVLKAPMPGLVLRVHVAAGQQVVAGAALVVLEAMKMENELKSAAAATVRAVRVKGGEAVEKGQILIEFEAAAAS
jgi:pyruvate carboxylase subunit B